MHRKRAFTLVEVLVVVVIAAIAAAVVMPTVLQPGSMRAQAAARAIIADILFAQNEAIAQQAERRVVFNPGGDSYRLTDGGGTDLPAAWKGGAYVVNLTDDDRFQGVSLQSADFSGGAELSFDAMGSPTSGGQVEIQAGSVGYRVTVATFTGRVTIEPITGG